MGLFSSLFGGGAKKVEEVNDENAQALKRFFTENLPSEFANSAKYAIAVTRGDKGYEARINMDMGADGSTYQGFAKENFEELADWESERVFDLLPEPPVTVTVIFDMDFGGKNKVTMNRGRLLAK
ncbi:hypothetical protein N510_002632 [Firmicutes bacterium ASF500]|nr:hypothetical protein N510_002632 [Firmicutes bacterium ASF500]